MRKLEAPFIEDMERKAEWFYESRGRLSQEQLSAKWHGALEQIDRMREARTESLDPGEPPEGSVGLAGGGKTAEVSQVDNPYPSASDHFASACAQVTGVDVQDGAIVTLRIRRGVAQRLELRTAGVFRFNDKTRRWNLVERSGLGAGGRYAWSLAHRDGVYAAIALPKDARDVALERFAYHFAANGVRTGEFARAADYFDRQRFRRFVVVGEELDTRSRGDKQRLAKLVEVHRETRALKDRWRGPLPNGGPPEWELMEHLAQFDAALLDKVNIGDLIGQFPTIYRLTNRVGRWYPLGPRNVNGRIKSLAIHPTQSNVLYAGAANGGIWKSTTSGQSWRSLWKFQDTMAVGSVGISPSAPDTLYVATGEDTPGWGPSYGGVGVYKSTNGGTSWTQKGSAATLGSACTKILVHPTNANLVYLASNSGVHKSTDGGDTWTRVRTGHATDLVMAHDHPDTLYAGIRNDGVYKTTDGGATWSRIESETVVHILFATIRIVFPRGSDAGWIKLAIGRSGPAGSNFIVAKLGANSATTLSSSDGGASWFPLGVSEGARYDEWCSFVAINPSDAKRIHVGSVGMQYTTNVWQWQHTSGTHSDHHQIVYDPTNASTCYAATDGGVYRSTNWGATWHLASEGLQATQLLSLGVAQTGTFVIGSATQDQGIIQSEGTSTWQDWGGGNEWGMFVVDPNDSNKIFISPGGGQLRRSLDRGRTYSNPTTGLTDWWASQNRQTQAASFAHVAVQPGNSNILIGAAVVSDEVRDANDNVIDSYPAKTRLYYSLNGGSSWAVSLQLPARGTRVAYAHDGVRAYAATEDGRFYRSDSCGIAGWAEAATGTNKPPTGYISCITVDPDEPDVVYITYTNRNPHVLRSTDGGQHWTSVSGTVTASSLPDMPASALVVDPENDDVLYVATDIGVFRSNDGGATWYFYNDSIGEQDLPKVLVTALAHRRSEDRLFASTLGRGLYYTYTSGIPRLRVLAISKTVGGHRYPGIELLRVTDGTDTMVMTRGEVIRRIEAGTNVYTRGVDGSRAEVQVMAPDNVHPRWYLRTTPDTTTADNLLSLPEF